MKKYLLIILLALFALPAKAIDYIDDDTVYEVMNNLTLRRPLVIEMWSDNCPGSRVVAPLFAEVARRYSSQAYFYKLDVSEYPSVINYFGINMLPCVLAIYYDYNEDGELVAYYDGYRGEPYLHTSNIDALVRRVVSNHITADR